MSGATWDEKPWCRCSRNPGSLPCRRHQRRGHQIGIEAEIRLVVCPRNRTRHQRHLRTEIFFVEPPLHLACEVNYVKIHQSFRFPKAFSDRLGGCFTLQQGNKQALYIEVVCVRAYGGRPEACGQIPNRRRRAGILPAPIAGRIDRAPGDGTGFRRWHDESVLSNTLGGVASSPFNRRQAAHAARCGRVSRGVRGSFRHSGVAF